MKFTIPTLFSIALLPQLSFALPAFKNYPAVPFTGKYKAIKIDRSNQIYKTVLTELKNEKINFAGKYVLSPIGCGGGCSNIAFYNAQNGHAGYLKQSFSDCYSEKHGFQMNDYEYQANSQLLIAIGRRSEKIEQCEKVYYLMKNDRLVEITHHPVWK
ncbi:hypothetical protein [Acinetobacter sp. WCHAc060025]|uniref:hypothetical protein n=1 Tax=Acinetobacter sp. WCHAc060025 TaxID=2518625 RepID=UPI001022F8C3|nr:hypothetical protein [Acinetobacter sp. WCHAc060025]RZG76262.1 hypothetical protein EXE09_08410 [Acinetobacter sp. WCHAc060025]